MGQTPFDSLFPPLPEGFLMPFWYASLQSLWVYYPVEPDLLRERIPVLDGEMALEPALFDIGGSRLGLASVDFQIYTSHGGTYLATVREVEFNVYTYPKAREPLVPRMTLDQYLAGEDQTKSIGGLRLHVPCDNPIAVQAGQKLFGEPKYPAIFTYTAPTLNDPSVTSWQYSVYQDDQSKQGDLIWSMSVELGSVPVVQDNPSPLVEYGVVLETGGVRRLVGNEWSFYGPFQGYRFDSANQPPITIDYGNPATDPTNTIADLQLLIGQTQPVAAQAFQSAPVSSECRATYAVPA